MSLEKAYIPYGAYWSSPFCRWQGSLSQLSSLELAARVAKRALAERQIGVDLLDSLVLGFTVPQPHGFYGPPWVAAMLGAPTIGGAAMAQACATSARVMASAALEVEVGQRTCVLALCCDRTSNGPHMYYPDPSGPGGMGLAENPVWDNFNSDPYAGQAMIQTAENVAREEGISRAEQEEVMLLRCRQYQDALGDERAFQRRYMVPIEVPKGKKATVTIEGDEGVFPTTAEGLGKLRPVLEGGTVTYGTQTFPADGNAGMIVCARDAAERMIRLVSYGEARVKKTFMPLAVVPAARQALERAGIGVGECRALKTHNPFAVNDVVFGRAMGVAPDRVNRYGSPLVWGHPQGPTGLRATIELIEELVLAGGGYGMFSGCAAGDTAMALVVKVG
jgi:acetyl-CoA acetyltransferase